MGSGGSYRRGGAVRCEYKGVRFDLDPIGFVLIQTKVNAIYSQCPHRW